MVTTVIQNNRVAIPAEVARQYGIRPGYRLEWQPGLGTDEIHVRVIPDRAELARRLLGAGRHLAPERNAVADRAGEG